MDFSTILPLTLGFMVLLFTLMRIERKWLWAAGLFTLLIAYLVWVWVQWNGRWAEVGTSLAIAGVLMGGWWLMIGRKLPPTVPTIQVWGQDAAPKPKAAELQAEVLRLREEKERLEAELQQLREGKKTEDGK